MSSASSAAVEQVTVFVVDDHPACRRAIASVVEMTPELSLAGVATSGNDALAQLDGLARPGLVLMDVNLGDASGIDITRQLVERDPGLRVVLVSTVKEQDLPADALSCGAAGFLRKDRLGPSVLVEASSPKH